MASRAAASAVAKSRCAKAARPSAMALSTVLGALEGAGAG